MRRRGFPEQTIQYPPVLFDAPQAAKVASRKESSKAPYNPMGVRKLQLGAYV